MSSPRNSHRLSEMDMHPGGQWTDLHPSFSRQVRALFKKQFVIKIRHWATIVEFAIACIIYIALYPIYILASTTHASNEHPIPEYRNTSSIQYAFFGMSPGPMKILLRPDCQNTRNLMQTLAGAKKTYGILYMVSLMKEGILDVRWPKSQAETENIIYQSDDHAISIHWVNAEQDDALISPKFEFYYQGNMAPQPDLDVYLDLVGAVYSMSKDKLNDDAVGTEKYLLNADFYSAQFATPSVTEYFDISMAIGIFSILPIVFSTMPDLQTLLEEKDSRVSGLGFLMGCSESAYWLVNFITPFVLSLIPYIAFILMLGLGFGLVGTDISLLLVCTILFLVSHIWFQLWLTTFMKKGSNGRAMTVVLLVFAIFFSYLHYFFTLDENQNSKALKHVFGIVPFSAYQMVLMAAYKRIYEDQKPLAWNTTNGVYPAWYGVMWLLIDSVLYFLLFLLFNATNSRLFGTAPIPWKDIFNKSAWSRLFNKKRKNTRIGKETDTFFAVSELNKTYKGAKTIQALDDVEFHVKTGEVIVMIGPNGAGKSTLINVLAGATEPDSGRIQLLGGDETNRFKEVQEYLGVCLQENIIINLLSVKEHFELFGAFRGVPQEQLDESIDFFAAQLQLGHMLDNRAGDLSGGQKRKLCIALSLLGNPPLVIMDEPTAGVDVQARQLIWKMISNLQDTTSIITSHALEEAEAVSSRLFIMASGKIKFAGTSTELRNQFKCGYILRVEREDGTVGPVLDLAKSFVPDAHITEERQDCIAMPVDPKIPAFLDALTEKESEYGVKTYSFAVEQLEDMLLKLIQSEEVNQQNH